MYNKKIFQIKNKIKQSNSKTATEFKYQIFNKYQEINRNSNLNPSHWQKLTNIFKNKNGKTCFKD